MAHFPKPFYKKSRACWYVEIDRKQIKLGPDQAEAFRLYHELMAAPRVQLQQPLTSASAVAIIDLYLDWVHKHRAPDTYEWYRYRLQRFAERYPDIRVSSLKPFHVEQWVDAYKMAETSRRNYFRSIKTCLRWAVKQGHIASNPLDGLEMPGTERKEVYFSPGQFETLLTYSRDDAFDALAITTYRTGCRPQESLIITADYVDLPNSRWVFPQSKSKGKKAPRIVYLDDEALAITKRLMLKHPVGPLFRNSRGNAWTPDAVNCVFDRIQLRQGRELLDKAGRTPAEEEIKAFIKTLKPTKTVKGVEREKRPAELRCEAKQKLWQQFAKKLSPRCSLYALRHSWATNALKRGVDPLTVALLMGHKDPSMLARVYQHLSHSPDHMLQQAKRANE